MKILHTVESYYPEIGGMSEVVRQLSERLVLLGHEVTVVAKKCKSRKENFIKGVNIIEFEISGNAVSGLDGEVESYREFLLNSNYDIVTNFAAQQWASDVAMPILDKIKGKKVNVPTGFSGLYWPEYKDYYESMKILMKGYDMNVFLSNHYRDINFAKENGITKNIVIPNGAAEDEFLPESKIDIRQKLSIKDDEFFILHVGSYTTIKGHKEALKIYLKSKIRNGVLVFVGFKNDGFQNYIDTSRKLRIWKKLNNTGDKKIVVTTFTREETVAAFKAADLFLFPSNMECSPIVLFEAMALGTPFLVTDVGNSNEINEWSKGGIILPTRIDNKGFSHARIKGSTKILNELFGNNQLRKQLAQYGFNAWKNNFSWETIAKKYEELYINLLN